MTQEYLSTPAPPPDLHIPPSKHTIQVSCIETTSRFSLPISKYFQPEYTGHPNLKGPSFSFLLTHPTAGLTLFDLGIRPDWTALPGAPKWIEAKWHIEAKTDVASILSGPEGGAVDVAGGAVKTVIWSHHHWDHVGDLSTFPAAATELVVGPGFKAAHLPGWPVREEATLLQSDVEGRKVREVEFAEEGGLKIGRFRAKDWFGDGSFYLLDTPGHSIGHICGLARTSVEPDTFVFMGGDAAHHGGEFRPTKYLPLPKEINPSPMKRKTPICPGHLLEGIHPHKSSNTPFYNVTENFAHDKKVADWTLDGLGEFDAHDTILMVMAHDDAVVDPAAMDFYPSTMNDWHKKQIGEKVRWLFLADFEEAVEAQEAGGKAYEWNPEYTTEGM